ncbi:hypothetical protein PBN151_4864 [Paenibacillus sp. NAIST15-1]|nr:hypothetical protein PBN151_4864 [Paenibacillus sp. NAIST15-1]
MRDFKDRVNSEAMNNSSTIKEINRIIRPKNVEANIINSGLTLE